MPRRTKVTGRGHLSAQTGARRHRPVGLAGWATLAVLAGFGGTSCGVGPRHTLNATSVASQISAQLASRYPVGKPTVVCPPGVPVKIGQSFVCTTVLDGQPVRMDGTVIGSNGRFTVVPESAIVAVADATHMLVSGITAQTRLHTSVSCGTKSVVVVAVGGSFSCVATLTGEQPRSVTVTVVDRQGHLHYSLGPVVSSSVSASASASHG